MAEPRPTHIAGFPALAAEGEGERRPSPLVFLHGAFADHQGFSNYVEFFSAAGFDCRAASHRGRQGIPPAGARGVRIENYLDDVVRILDAIGAPPVVVGHSMGGLLAQKVAEAGRCRAAILLAPAPPGMLTAQPRSLPVFLPHMPRILSGRPFLISSRDAGRLALNRVPEPERELIYATFVPESGAAYRQMLLGTVRVAASKVRCPVLCVGGTDDRIISPRLLRRTARKYDAQVIECSGHGHWLPQEPGWEAPARDMLAWLDETALSDVSRDRVNSQ